MEKPDRPNLFTYATSELSQDAFICWLAAWADPKFKDADPALHQRDLPEQPYTPYLQLENNELCFKIEVIDETRRQEARDEAHRKLVEAGKQLNMSVKRPDRMGNGRYMTVAKWPKDYRKPKDGKLDFEATLKNLRKAQQILDTAFPQ